ncbi:alkene reductase [Stratiformator vulcanicus]|uniref:N-ethylmaleimide reductase n=1 Tax=Stratiformator vulcanicus TaxID=2527980 RepID=A0A517R4L6_9PLAN|nr:alkene reductase [Stratiformator vulcanicus]QDT38827.1 N-ethylmaleimide reductase [Stratiformator vulcanicus]
MAGELISAYELGDLTLKNRIVMAPMTRGRCGSSGVPGEMNATYYRQRAGAGLIITEGTFISPQANGWVGAPGIFSPQQVEGWKPVVDGVHDAGTPIFCQLWHCGRASHSTFQPGNQKPVAPSEIAINSDYIHTPNGKQPNETPRALTTEELPGIVEDYRLAARNAKAAGFDGVEIHGANGYLIDEFLQTKTNERSDQYGGSLENRFRFLKEIVEAVTSVFPSNRVGVRQSPNGVYNDMGSPDYRDTFLYVAEQLAKFDLGYLHVMDGLGFGFHELGEPVTLGDYRKVYPGTLMGNCGHTKDDGEQRIADGVAELIAFGRPFITNPDLPARFENGWPLADDPPQAIWYSPGPEGYIDQPAHSA